MENFTFDFAGFAPDELAATLSNLMDEVEALGGAHTSDGDDPRMKKIMELANYLSWFYPDLLDKRFA